MAGYSRNIAFTTTEENQNILTIEAIKNAIIERLKISQSEYDRRIDNEGFDMKFDVFCSATKISINDGVFNELLEDVVYSTDDFYKGIKSIKIQNNNITGLLSFRII